MKKFVFSMEKLQNYKEQVLESEKNTLGILRKELNTLTAELESLLQLIDNKSNELEHIMICGTTNADLAAHKRYITIKQHESHEVRRRIAEKEAEIERQLGVVVEATKEVSTLEKLEERQLEEHKYAEMKEGEHFIEEFVGHSRIRAQSF